MKQDLTERKQSAKQSFKVKVFLQNSSFWEMYQKFMEDVQCAFF